MVLKKKQPTWWCATDGTMLLPFLTARLKSDAEWLIRKQFKYKYSWYDLKKQGWKVVRVKIKEVSA